MWGIGIACGLLGFLAGIWCMWWIFVRAINKTFDPPPRDGWWYLR